MVVGSKEGCKMFSWFRKQVSSRTRGFTLLELVVVLSILGILLALAVPRYLSARKSAYRAEADHVLQETKTMEWAYYQQFDKFDISGSSIGFSPPGGMHWANPSFGGIVDASVQILMTGCASGCAPIGTGDRVSLVLYSDGTLSGGSSF
jgi:prepilin-type N-terminal cleavage/methylation domain-containing protein